MANESIGVTFSIYGSFDHNRLELAAKSVLNQTYNNLELIVSEQNSKPLFKKKSEELGLKYVFTSTEKINEKIIYNPGRIRNEALNIVNSDFVYTNDADIIFKNPDFLKNLLNKIKKNPNSFLEKPPMRRLLISDFRNFKKNVEKDGLKESLNNLINPNAYTAVTSPKKIILVARTDKSGRTYTIEYDKFQDYLSNKKLKGLEPTIWHETVHCGGIFAEKTQIETVGGYSEEYITWGHEDRDLQWKLSECFNHLRIPYATEFEVLHLDHIKGYFNPKTNKKNTSIFQKRVNKGLEYAVQKDLDNGTSSFVKKLR